MPEVSNVKGIMRVSYDLDEWNAMTKEDQDKKRWYYTEMAKAQDAEYLMLDAEPDELFGNGGERTVLYSISLKQHNLYEQGMEFVKNYYGDGSGDTGYAERNMLVYFLAKLFKGGRRDTDIEGWEPEWNGCVYVEIPGVGQCSWHYHSDMAELFADLPEYKKPYTGHTTEDKYARILAYAKRI